MTEKKAIKNKETDYKYSKEQFLNSTKPIGNVDALYVVLEDGKYYSRAEAKKLLDEFLNKEIKPKDIENEVK